MAFLIAPPNNGAFTDHGSALTAMNDVQPGFGGEGFIASPEESTLLQGTRTFGFAS